MKLLKTIKHDFFEIIPPTIFFFIAFSLILATKLLMLREIRHSLDRIRRGGDWSNTCRQGSADG